jgi:hypothetical protein
VGGPKGVGVFRAGRGEQKVSGSGFEGGRAKTGWDCGGVTRFDLKTVRSRSKPPKPCTGERVFL